MRIFHLFAVLGVAAFATFNRQCETIAAEQMSVSGIVVSADPKSGVVVVDTDEGNVAIQVTPKTANFKLIAVGKALKFKVKESGNGMTAISVATTTAPKAKEPANSKSAGIQTRYGFDPVLVGDESIRPNVSLLEALSEIDLSQLFEFKPAKKAEIVRRKKDTLISVEGKIHANKRVWESVSTRLRELFEPLSDFKLEGINTYGRQERSNFNIDQKNGAKYEEYLPFWQRFERSLVYLQAPGKDAMPFGNASMIPAYGKKHPESWHCWAIVCVNWDESAPPERNSADWVAYHLNFDMCLTLEEINRALAGTHELQMQIYDQTGTSVKGQIRPMRPKTKGAGENVTVESSGYIARPFVRIMEKRSHYEGLPTVLGDCWIWHPFLPQLAIDATSIEADGFSLKQCNGTQPASYQDTLIVPEVLSNLANDVSLTIPRVSTDDRPHVLRQIVGLPIRESEVESSHLRGKPAPLDPATKSLRQFVMPIQVRLPGLMWSEDQTRILVSGSPTGILSVNCTSPEDTSTIPYPVSMTDVLYSGECLGRYLTARGGKKGLMALIPETPNAMHRVTLLNIDSGRVEATLIRTRVYHNERGIPDFETPTNEMASSSVRSLACSIGGEHVAIVTLSGDVGIWNISRKTFKTIKHPTDRTDFKTCVFSPNGRNIALADSLGGLIICDVESGKPMVTHQTLSDRGRFPTVNVEGWKDPVTMKYSADGSSIIIGHRFGCTAVVCDSKSGRVNFCCECGSRGGVWALDVHPKQPVFATGVSDGHVRIWSSKTGKLLDSLAKYEANIGSLAFSPLQDCLALHEGWENLEAWNITSAVTSQ